MLIERAHKEEGNTFLILARSMNFPGLKMAVYSPLDWGNVHRYVMTPSGGGSDNTIIYVDMPTRVFPVNQASVYDMEIISGHDNDTASSFMVLEMLGFIAHSDQNCISISCGGLWVFITGHAAALNYNAWAIDDPVRVIVNPQ